MTAYILRRLLLIIPTMFGIMLVTFVIIQFAPGGPVERLIAQLAGTDVGATSQFSGGTGDFMRGILLWLIGIPIPIIILLWLFGVLH